MTEDEMIGWHYGLNGHECEQTLGDGEVQGDWQSMGSQRVGHDGATEQHTYIHMKSRKILNIQLHVCLVGWFTK